MGKMKKLAGILLILVLVMSMATTAFAAPVDLTKHEFVAYQIFSGTQAEGSAELGQVQWGSGIDGAAFLTAIKADAKLKVEFENCSTAADVAKELGTHGDGSDVALAFARVAYDHKTGTGTEVENGQSGLPAGYYLVVDVTAFDENETDTVYNLALLQLTNDEKFEIALKTDIPSVDKEVLDEVADAEAGAVDGWGETADHAINENFQFKLKANLPKEINFAEYEKYKVEFVDTMSKGITFVSINSIKVDGVEVQLGQYDISTTAVAGTEGEATWTITFPDLKVINGVDLADGAQIEVVYTAYLNEEAKVNHVSGDTTNKNGVFLRYSNNPNTTGEGKTEKDYVWVFTYDVNNTKYSKEIKPENVLAGAGFRLYTDKACTSEVALIWDADLKAYRPVKSGETGQELVSRSEDALKGQFNIVGLDAGTYYLSETTVPDGYNKCKDIEIVIKATHIEATTGATATTTLTESKGMDNEIVNETGSVLPETGGMGTTLFYIVGAILVIGAGVILVTKKRMNEN